MFALPPCQNATADTQSKQLMQAINVLVLKVMENSDRTAILHTLIAFLKRAHPAGPSHDPSAAECSAAFVDLVVRCLSKLIRTFQSSGMLLVDMERLLQDVHAFLALPAPPVTDGSSTAEQASRAVRSILALMVQVKGEALQEDVARALPSDSPVPAVVDKAIANWRAKNGQSAMVGSGQFTPHYRSALRAAEESAAEPSVHSAAVAQPPSAQRPALGGAEYAEANGVERWRGAPAAAAVTARGGPQPAQPPLSASDLSSLVSAVLTPATTRAGLTALAAFAAAHPSIDVMAAFSAQSDSFRAYVQRNIALQQQQPHYHADSTAHRTEHVPQRPQSAGPTASGVSASSMHSRVGSASTDALRERLAALQSKAKAVATAPASSVNGAHPPPAAFPASSALRPAAVIAGATAVAAGANPPILGGRPSLPASVSSSAARSSMSSQSMDAIKQRFAAIHTQRLSGAPNAAPLTARNG